MPYPRARSSRLDLCRFQGKGKYQQRLKNLAVLNLTWYYCTLTKSTLNYSCNRWSLRMFIFTDSCTCHPFSGFLPVLAVFRQCFGYFLLEYQISRVPFSVDINANDVNFPVISISWIISCSSFPMTFPRLMRAREWWIFTTYVYYFTWPSNNCLQIMVCSCAM